MLIILTQILSKDTFECRACKDGMQVIYDLLSEGAGNDLIHIALEEVCLMFPEGQWRDECDKFITLEFDSIIKMLEADFPVETLCILMSACDYPLPPVNAGCDFCVLGFTVMYDIFEFDSETGLNAIEVALDYICYMFPEGETRTTCEQFINQEYDELVHYISHEFSPEAICNLVDACEGPDPVYKTECEFCRIFYQLALDMIDFDASIDTIEELLEHICDIFQTQATQKVCHIFVDKNYEKIINALISNYSTEVACEAFGACIA
ncbi:Saposin [Hexamita inflata]|uniref:Putative n=1 Tax=Hexamita inflata TaxID=28002 RepID=A0AA86NWM9_9EUKA|nr:Saposin [Hexamita inflata]